MNWKGCGRLPEWLNLRHNSVIQYLEQTIHGKRDIKCSERKIATHS